MAASSWAMTLAESTNSSGVQNTIRSIDGLPGIVARQMLTDVLQCLLLPEIAVPVEQQQEFGSNRCRHEQKPPMKVAFLCPTHADRETKAGHWTKVQ